MAVPYRVRDTHRSLNPYSYSTFLPGLFEREEYSDLTIKCGDDVHRVHRVIVCPQSAVFSAMCRGSFKEAQTREINLPYDDPPLIRIMIYYMYGHGYRASKAKALRSPVTGPWLDLDICTLANKNDLEPLQQSAKNHFREWAEQAWSEPDFPSVVERIWDMEHLVSVQHMIEEVIADHAKDLCSPIGGSGDSLIKKVLCRKDLLKGSSFASCRGQKRRLRKVIRARAPTDGRSVLDLTSRAVFTKLSVQRRTTRECQEWHLNDPDTQEPRLTKS